MFSQIKKITKMAKKEVINKVITSLFIQGLAREYAMMIARS